MVYWLIINGQQQGPLTLDEVLAHPLLTPETPVWREGLDDWATAELFPEFQVRFVIPDVESEPVIVATEEKPSKQPLPAWWTNDDRASHKMPPTNLTWAIIATICCCLVTGIIAIVYASQVAPCYYRGEYERANDMSEKALIWVLVSFVAGLVFTPFYILFSLL